MRSATLEPTSTPVAMEASDGQGDEVDRPLEEVKPLGMRGREEKRVLEGLVLESRE